MLESMKISQSVVEQSNISGLDSNVGVEEASSPLAEAVHSALSTSKQETIHSQQNLASSEIAQQTATPLTAEEKEQAKERNSLSTVVGAWRELKTAMSNVAEDAGSDAQIKALTTSIKSFENSIEALPDRFKLTFSEGFSSLLGKANTLAEAQGQSQTNQVRSSSSSQASSESSNIKEAELDATQMNGVENQSINRVALTNTQVIECDAEIVDIFKSILVDKEKSGFHVQRNENDSVASLQAKYVKTEALITPLIEDTAVSSLLFQGLSEKLIGLKASELSLANFEETMAELVENKNLPLESQWEGLGNSLILAKLDIGQKCIDAHKSLKSDNIHERLKAESFLETNFTLIKADIKKLEQEVNTHVAEIFNKAFEKEGYTIDIAEHEQIQLAEFLVEANLDPVDLAESIKDAMESYYPIDTNKNMTSDEQKAALHAARQAFINMSLSGLSDKGESLSTRLQYVDALFQHDYAHHDTTALLLKQAIVPADKQADVEIAHNYTVSVQTIKSVLIDNGGLPSFELNMNRASSRSFVLTPDLVKNLLKENGHVKDLNYHLSHIALLQAEAMSTGLIASNDKETQNFVEWFKGLGLGNEATERGLDMAASLEKARSVNNKVKLLPLVFKFNNFLINNASALRNKEAVEFDGIQDNVAKEALGAGSNLFEKGLSGVNQAKKADASVMSIGKIGTQGSAEKVVRNIFNQSHVFNASVALDHHISNLSGLILTGDRLVDAETGLAYDQDKVNANISEKITALREKLANAPAGTIINPEDFRQVLSDKAEASGFIRARQLKTVASAKFLTQMGEALNENVTLKARVAERDSQRSEQKEIRKSISFSWPHRRSERKEIYQSVIRLSDLNRQVNSGINTQGDPCSMDEIKSMNIEINSILEKLKGVDPYSLVSTKNEIYNRKPSVETVLSQMLPRAKSLEHHHTFSSLKESASLKLAHRKLSSSNTKINKHLNTIKKALGSEAMSTIRTAYKASVLQTFIGKGGDASEFSMLDSDNIKQVHDNLEKWGIKADEGLLPYILPALNGELCDKTGLLKASLIEKDSKKFKLELAGKEAYKEQKAEMREEGRTRIGARKAARKEIFKSEEYKTAVAFDGVKGIMAGASKVGDSFVIDRARGKVLDTGKKFSVTGKREKIIENPLTVSFSSMKDKSVSVVNAGQNGFEVIIKDSALKNAGVGANLGFSIFMASAKLEAGKDNVNGLALRFTDAESCESFLAHMLDTNKSKVSQANVWEKAASINFITEKGFTAKVGASLSVDLINQAVLSKEIVVAATAGTEIKTNIRHSSQENAFGVTHVVEKSFSFMNKAVIGVSFDDAAKKSTKDLKEVGYKETVGGVQRVEISQGIKGISGAMTFSTVTGMEGNGRSLASFVPSKVVTNLRSNDDFMRKLDALFHELPFDATVSLKMELSPDKQKRIDELSAEARQGNKALLEKAEKEIHDILGDVDSYKGSTISFTSTVSSVKPKETQIGLGVFKFARENTFANTQTTTINLRDYF